MALTQVNSDGINDNSIVNADLNSAANIASTKLAKPIDLADNEKVRFGTGNDLEILHNGSHSFVVAGGVGDLFVRNTNLDKDIVLTSDDGSGGNADYIRCDGSDGMVRLYYYGSEKFQTVSGGVNIIGEMQCDSLDVDGNAHFSGGADTTVTFEGTNDVLLHLKADTGDNNENGNPEIKFTQDGSQHVLSVGVNGETGNSFTDAVANNAYIRVADGHVGTCGLDLATNNTRRLTLNNNGHLFPASNNTYDLGKSNAKFANIYSENFVGSGGLKSIQVFESVGSHTWTKPSGITKVRVTVTGGGGGGGGGTASWNTGQGGGAGGTAIEVIDVSSVSSVSVTVGSGGAGATGHTQNTSSANGSNGGTSSFGSYCSATGGEGGDEGWGNVQDIGNGGSGSGGNINLSGGDAISKGGGDANDQTTASLGGASYWGGGGKGGDRGDNGLRNANNGKAYGSGGGGGGATDTDLRDGGSGRAGIVVVEEFA